MAKRTECRTVAQYEAAIKSGDVALVIGLRVTAWENSTVEALENSTVTARENSTVTAWGNSTVTALGNSTVTALENSTVTAWGNSTVTAWGNSTVTAWGNSTVTALENSTVTARENSTVEALENSTVEAWENSTVTAWGNVFIRLFKALAIVASAHVVVMIHGPAVKLEGGVHVQAMEPKIGSEWCEYYGIDLTNTPLKVENLDTQILQGIEADKIKFDMSSWHGNPNCDETNWCGTTHCRAGAAICLVGKPAFDLERKLDAATVGVMIYAVSYPDLPLPDFSASNDAAMADMRQRAGLEDAAE